MNFYPSERVFPSYHAIKAEIQHRYVKQYQAKIGGLKKHLAQLQTSHNFQKDHEEIQLSIMTLAAENGQESNRDKEKIKVIDQQQRRHMDYAYGESLNYYLEDDREEGNNY
jgi:hypothetical protein